MMELTHNEISDLMNRFPAFELSYETLSHKKVSSAYNLCLSIAQGKKYFIWFTYFNDLDVCILFDLNRDKIITKAKYFKIDFNANLCLGTILYGTIVEDEIKSDKQFFVIEDIFYYKGIVLKQMNLNNKLNIIKLLLNDNTINNNNYLHFSMSFFWNINKTEEYECMPNVPPELNDVISYPIHHIQYRCLYETKPYLNVFLNRKLNFSNIILKENKKEKTHDFETIDFVCDFSKPQYKYPSIFQVVADIQFDIYHLFAYGYNNKSVYYGVACIPNYKTSVFMNQLFRNIKENKNLDLIEESDDEDEFENMNEDKFVDVEKVLLMECVFNTKFKKWIPTRLVNDTNKFVHISKLQYIHNNHNNNYNNHYPKQINSYNKENMNNNKYQNNYYNNNDNQNVTQRYHNNHNKYNNYNNHKNNNSNYNHNNNYNYNHKFYNNKNKQPDP